MANAAQAGKKLSKVINMDNEGEEAQPYPSGSNLLFYILYGEMY